MKPEGTGREIADRPAQKVSHHQAVAADDSPESSSDEESSGAEEEGLREQLEDIPFELLEKLQTDGSGVSGKAAAAAAAAAKARAFKRENKHRPVEMSSKRPVPRYREVLQVAKKAKRDPRFDEVAGHYDKDVFRQRYAFVYDEVLPRERREAREQAQRVHDEGKKRELRAAAQRAGDMLRDEEARRQRRQLEKSIKLEHKAGASAAPVPYFPKKKEVRERELLAKYEELKASGKLERFLEKKRRKRASKDHKLIPSQRRGE